MSGHLTRDEQPRSFAQIPDALIADLRVSGNAVRLWGRLDRYAGENAKIWVGRQRLASDLGVSIPTISRLLAELVDAGWITRTPRDGGTWDTHLNHRPRITSDTTRIKFDTTPDQKRSGRRIKSDPQKESQLRRESKKTPTESSKRAPRSTTTGTRIPDDFAVADEMKSWASENAPHAGARDHEQFVDYWRAQPGAKGRKADWPATWRNWMRKASDERSGQNDTRRPRQSATERAHSEADQALAQLHALHDTAASAALNGSSHQLQIGS